MIIGLTGGIAVGKSTVSKTFVKYGVPIVDADQVARQVVEPGSDALEKIISLFGKEFLNDDFSLNRTKLGKLVFKDKEALNKLNDILRPIIEIEATKQLTALERDYNYVIYDAALIIENGNADKYRPLIVVSCPSDIQIKRLMLRNKISEEEAKQIISSQMTTEEKIKFADFIIDTSREINDSINQTLFILKSINDKF